MSIFVRSYCDIQTHREVEGEKHRDGDRGCSPGRRRGIGVAASAEGQQINRPHVAQVCSRSQNRNVTINLESNGHAPPRQAPFLQMLVMELLIFIFYFFFPPHPIIKIYTYLRCKIMDRSCLDSRSRHKWFAVWWIQTTAFTRCRAFYYADWHLPGMLGKDKSSCYFAHGPINAGRSDSLSQIMTPLEHWIWLCLIYAAFMSPIYLCTLAVLCKITSFYALFKWAISQFICRQGAVVFSRCVNHSREQLLLITNQARCWSLILEMCLLSNHFYRGFSDLVTNTWWN